MDTEAQNFRGNYPLAGGAIGVAWREAWARLDYEWRLVGPLAEQVAAAAGLTEHSVRRLLADAVRLGVLETRDVGWLDPVAQVRVVPPGYVTPCGVGARVRVGAGVFRGQVGEVAEVLSGGVRVRLDADGYLAYVSDRDCVPLSAR